MSNITFGGFATGLDTNAIIDAFVKAERAPIDKLLSQKTAVEAASQTISNISTKLGSLREAALALGDPAKFAAMAATSSDPNVVASTTVGAVAGKYEVTVTQLAKEQRTYGDTETSGTDALGEAGTLSIQVGAASAIDVDIDTTDSLSAIAAKINASGARVSANVLYDGTSYRLSVRGLDTGAANAITFGESGLALGLSTPANTKQAAQDANLSIDGIAVTRSTNQITGLIQGVTLALTKVSPDPVTVTVASDGSSLRQKVSAFVSAYNDVMKASQSAAGYGAQKASNAMLASDPTLRAVMDKLSRVMSAPVAGTSGKYTSLMSTGISSTKDGMLKFDETIFNAALVDDATGVAKVFTKDATLGSTGAFAAFKTAVDALNGSPTAPVVARIASLQKQATRITDTTDAMERRITAYTDGLRKQFSELETVVARYKAQGSSITGGSSSSG